MIHGIIKFNSHKSLCYLNSALKFLIEFYVLILLFLKDPLYVCKNFEDYCTELNHY